MNKKGNYSSYLLNLSLLGGIIDFFSLTVYVEVQVISFDLLPKFGLRGPLVVWNGHILVNASSRTLPFRSGRSEVEEKDLSWPGTLTKPELTLNLQAFRRLNINW